jgi:hypothetical protein
MRMRKQNDGLYCPLYAHVYSKWRVALPVVLYITQYNIIVLYL